MKPTHDHREHRKVAGVIEAGEDESQGELDDLRGQQDRFFVESIGQHAAEQHEGDERQLARELPPAQVRGVLELRVNDPREGHVLDPGADAGEEGPGPDQAEVANLEGREKRGKAGSAGAFGGNVRVCGVQRGASWLLLRLLGGSGDGRHLSRLQDFFAPLAPTPDFLVPFNHRVCLSPKKGVA
jgi:hypothetical protein